MSRTGRKLGSALGKVMWSPGLARQCNCCSLSGRVTWASIKEKAYLLNRMWLYYSNALQMGLSGPIRKRSAEFIKCLWFCCRT